MFGTPSGLLNETKNFVDYDNISEWSQVLQRVKILTTDFADIDIPENKNVLIYNDPPYRKCFTTYGADFDDTDQIRLLEWCLATHKRTNARIVLSNKSDGHFFQDRQKKYKYYIETFNATHTAGRRLRQNTENGIKYSAIKVEEVILVWKSSKK